MVITNPRFTSLGKGIYIFSTSWLLVLEFLNNKSFRLLKNSFPLEIGWIFLAM